jgi:hypothetical protein
MLVSLRLYVNRNLYRQEDPQKTPPLGLGLAPRTARERVCRLSSTPIRPDTVCTLHRTVP